MGKPHAKTVAWSYDMEGHCELANKKTEQPYKVSSPCLDDHHFQKEELLVVELSKVCSQIVLKCLYFARTGGADILWSVNKLASAVTKRTGACARRIARLISNIHHACECNQYCHVGNTANNAGWDCFKTQILLATLRTQNQPRWESYLSLEVEHSSLSVGCARNKRQYATVLQNQKSFRWMLVCEWMDYLFSLMGCGDRSVTFIEQYPSSRKLFAESQIQTQTKG